MPITIDEALAVAADVGCRLPLHYPPSFTMGGTGGSIISLPPGRFGGPWIDRLFTGTLDPAIDPYLATLRHNLAVAGARALSHPA